jgi:hypothetical protein
MASFDMFCIAMLLYFAILRKGFVTTGIIKAVTAVFAAWVKRNDFCN